MARRRSELLGDVVDIDLRSVRQYSQVSDLVMAHVTYDWVVGVDVAECKEHEVIAGTLFEDLDTRSVVGAVSHLQRSRKPSSVIPENAGRGADFLLQASFNLS